MFFNYRIPTLQKQAYFYDSISGLAQGVFNGLTLAFISVVARRLGASNVQMGFLTATVFIGALFTFQWSEISVRYHPVKFYYSLRLVSRFVLFSICLISDPKWYVALMLIYWTIEMGTAPSYSGIIKQVYPSSIRSKAMAYVRTEMALVTIGCNLLAGRLLDLGPDSYRYVFPFGIGAGLLAVLFFRRIPYEHRWEEEQREFTQPKFFLRRFIELLVNDERLRRYQMINIVFGFGVIISLPLYPIFMVDNLQLSNMQIGAIGAVFGLAWLVSYVVWGEVIHRKEPLQILPTVFLVSSFVPLVHVFATGPHLLFLAAFFNGIIAGGVELGRMNYIIDLASDKKIQNYSGLNLTIMGCRGIVGSFVGIFLMRYVHIRVVFFLSFLTVLTSAWLIYRHYQWEQRRQRKSH